MASSTDQAPRYQQLLERADAFVTESGGRVHEDLLIRHVFGTASCPDMWRPLLRQLLSESDRLCLRGDGFWMAITSDPGESDSEFVLAGSYVVIDVETTGLKPAHHRVIEFGAVRFEDGVQTGTLSSLIQPERRVPQYVSKLTGIDDSLLADAPLFSQVVEEILEFIEDVPLIGYNIGFDVSFLNSELQRSERPTLLNHAIDLLPVASALMPGSRARGLSSLVRELNIASTGAHRALNDALSTAEVMKQLLPQIRASGITTLAELDGFRGARRDLHDTSGPHARGRSLLDPDHVASAPSAPGVYIMRSAAGRILYVGKAKDLRARIRSYYSQPLGYTRKMDGLLESIEQIETVETGSELAALLLEAQLIVRHSPQFNRQMRTSDNYPYIRIELNNPWPRVTLAREARDDGATYYGPYRSSRAARATVDALNDIFPLRSCSRSFKNARSYGSPCVDLDFGRCLGPCTGQANREEYFGYVREILAFLEDDVDPVMNRLHRQLEVAAERLDFERAARVRNRIERVSELSQSQRVLSDALKRGQLAIVLPGVEDGEREIMLTRHGRAWSRRTLHLEEPNEDIARDLERSWSRACRLASPVILQHELDSVQILTRWVRKHWEHPSIFIIDDDDYDWVSLVDEAKTVDLIV